MAAVSPLALAGPRCPVCSGTREVNGAPCYECDAAPRARSWRGRLLRWADRLAAPAGTAVRWSATLPGIAGAAAVTWGLAVVVHGIWHQVPVLGVAALAGGAFALALDRRL